VLEHQRRSRWIDRQHAELLRIGIRSNEEIRRWSDDHFAPRGPAGRQQHPVAFRHIADVRTDRKHASDPLATDHRRQGWPHTIQSADLQQVGRIDRRVFDLDQRVIRAGRRRVRQINDLHHVFRIAEGGYLNSTHLPRSSVHSILELISGAIENARTV